MPKKCIENFAKAVYEDVMPISAFCKCNLSTHNLCFGQKYEKNQFFFLSENVSLFGCNNFNIFE